jgi:uncharacterized repeat protein (TIGR01451 family)
MLKIKGAAIAFAASVVVGGISSAISAAEPAYVVVDLVPANQGEIKGQVPDRASTFAAPSIAARPLIPFGVGYGGEIEPNNAVANATPLNGTSVVVKANLYPNGDVDYYKFNARAGDRIYSAVMTTASAGSSNDGQLTLLASNGTTVIEFDDDNGSFAAFSPSIAGASIPADGEYYLKYNDYTAGTTSQRGYELYFRLQSASESPTSEVEPNDTAATAMPLPANGWVSGARNTAAVTEQDWYSLSLNAGDTVFLSLDLDPERDGVTWNGRLGLALFGDLNNQILVVDDGGTGDVAPLPNIPSEALFLTVKESGTYYAFVDSASATTGGATATYHLSVSVLPATDEGVNCTTYSSSDVPKTIGPGTGLTTSTITIPGNPRIADIDVTIQLNHALMQDVDAHLLSPGGTDVGLFTDIGASAVGGQSQMDLTFDDEAASLPTFNVLKGLKFKPENSSTTGTVATPGAYRLSWFDGQDAGGEWTLKLWDDTAGENGGTLTAWSVRICEMPPPPACPTGYTQTTVYSTDFEAGDAGFTHSGTADEWERGTPATAATTSANPIAAFDTCHSGSNCWKTDLDGTYNASSSQDLLSPEIDLTGLAPPIVVSWAHRHQVEAASFDHYFVDFEESAGGPTKRRVFEWLDPTPISASAGTGNPQVNIGAGIGWGVQRARVDELAGKTAQLRFHLDSDSSVNYGGVAIDDVSVTACRLNTADLSITKTDGVTSAVPGSSVTYTITASNAGPSDVTGATVTDTFPASLTCTWTCVGAGGGTCPASGSGNINSAVNLPAGGSTTHTASCMIAASATGALSNTATVTAPADIPDPTPDNNSATDTDALVASADLSISKTDGVTTATPGGSVIYTITASNVGPSDATGATVTDTFPAPLTCTWTCVGSGGGTCPASGSGNINSTVNLPVGGSTIHTASCTISSAATGTLSNTATVTAPAGITDPTPGSNSATDTDTLVAIADLSITKTDGVTSAVPGDSVTYTITASNAGPSDATGATVTDTFPASLTCTWTCVGAGGGTCPASGSGNINSTVNLPAGGSTIHTASCTISSAATGTLSNTATVTVPAGITDPTPGNNSATDTDTLSPSADLSITKTDGVTSAVPGGSVTYTITASNAGPSDATGALLSDAFPSACTSATWTCTGAGGGVCTPSGSGNIFHTVNLPVGGTVTYSANCSIAASATGSLSNTATISVPASMTDPVASNNSATDTDALGAEADLSITKTDGVTSATPGGSVTYTITASNAGPSNAAGVTVTDTFPVSCTSPTWSCVGASGGTCTASGSGNIADVVNLPSGASVTYTAICPISASATGTLSNTATVTAPVDVTDPTPSNNSATDTDALGAEADLSISKTDGVTSVQSGDTLTYTITASNAGPSDVLGATVSDVFPSSCVSTTWTCAGSGTSSCSASGTGNIADSVNLPSGGSVTYTASCVTDASTANGTVISNTASVTAPASVTDPTPGNNSATDTTTAVLLGNAITATKSVSGGNLPGASITYTIVMSNAGPGEQGDNAGDELVDVLPSALSLVSASASSGTAVADVGSNTVTWNGSIAAGASVTLTIQATIRSDATPGLVSNQATFNADLDGNGSNETPIVTDDPSVGGASDPTVIQVLALAGEVRELPINKPMTMIVMILGMGMLGVGLRRRAKRREM